MEQAEKRIRRRLHELEILVQFQLAVIIALFIGFCAFAVNTHNKIQEGMETMQEIKTYSTRCTDDV